LEAKKQPEVSKSVSGTEPHSFRNIKRLKISVMSSDINFPENDLPVQADMFYIEDCFDVFTG